MTVPTPIQQRIRILDARGVSWRRISKEVGVSRQTVRKYAQLEDCSPEPPARPAAVSKLDPYKPLIDKWLEADRFMPRKQRHTARRVYDRLVEEQGFDGSYQIVQRYVKRWRQEHRLPGDGYPGVGVVAGRDAGGFRFGAGRGGGEPDGRALPGGVVSVFEHAVRGGVARGQRGVRLRGAARGVRAHRRRAAGAGARTTPPARRTGSRGTGSWWWRCSRGSSRITGSKPGVRDPGAGNEKGSVENAVGFLRRNVMVPLPNAESHAQLTRFMLSRCDRIAEDPHYRKGKPVRDLFARDREAMAPMPGTRFDACRWEVRKADGEGCAGVDSHRYLAGPSWRGWTLDVGLRAFDAGDPHP